MAKIDSLRASAQKLASDVSFTDDALEAIAGAPRFIHSIILKGCVEWAHKNGVSELTAKEIDVINEERKRK